MLLFSMRTRAALLVAAAAFSGAVAGGLAATAFDVGARAGAVLLAATGAALLTGSAAALVAGRALGAIRRITRSLQRAAAGELEHRASAEAGQEAAALVRAYNEMAARLGDLVAQEADERTRLASIVSAMTDGVLVVDAEGRVELANPAALEMLGVDVAFESGLRLVALSHNYDINRLVRECFEDGQPHRAHVDMPDLRRFIQALAVPLKAAGRAGAEGRALLLLTDLTEMRRVEVTRREFISNASHELRTPLAAIRASAETLERGAARDPEAAPGFLRRIRDDVVRMDRMLSELLELSRLESGQAPLHLAPADPAGLAARAVERFRPQADESGIGLAIDAGAAPPVTADADKMEQVLANLLSNALKATPRGGSVTLGVVRQDGAVELSVSDSGQGIAADSLPHVFERFYKVSTARDDGGAGLGLAIAKHIVQAHGGQVSVESTLGVGSTFTVRLPLAVGFQE